MAKIRLGVYTVTEEDMNMLTKLFADPLMAQQFVSFLDKVKRTNEQLHGQTAQMYLMTDSPEQRAMSLAYKGKAEFALEMTQLVKQVNK